MKFLTWLWQSPQHILALIIKQIYKKKIYKIIEYKTSKVIWLKGTNWGVSLGQYIFLSVDRHNTMTVKHEYGHSIQSMYLGWLYLLIIGIPSGTMNRLSYYKIINPNNYYKRWPENWADKLGGVER